MEIIGPRLQRREECEAVLRSLPRWFGIEASLLMYARDSATMPTFAVEREGKIEGFITVRMHFPESWDVHCIAVAAGRRRHGLGRMLLVHAEAWIRGQGGQFLQIKTIAASSPSPEYAETRKFYERMGYTPVEVFPTLWSPKHPALQLIKALGAA